MLRCFTFSDPLCVAGHQDCWTWLQGNFHLVQIADGLCNAMSEGKWQGWLSSNPLNVHLMTSLLLTVCVACPLTGSNRCQAVPQLGQQSPGRIWRMTALHTVVSQICNRSSCFCQVATIVGYAAHLHLFQTCLKLLQLISKLHIAMLETRANTTAVCKLYARS